MKKRQRRSFSAEMKSRIALEAIKGQKTIQEIASQYPRAAQIPASVLSLAQGLEVIL